MSAKPITPDEAHGNRVLPDEVIEAFNEMIIEKYKGGVAKFKKKDVVVRIKEKISSRGDDMQVLDYKMLDVEGVCRMYRKVGWEVTYDRPAYYDTYDANFSFKRKK